MLDFHKDIRSKVRVTPEAALFFIRKLLHASVGRTADNATFFCSPHISGRWEINEDYWSGLQVASFYLLSFKAQYTTKAILRYFLANSMVRRWSKPDNSLSENFGWAFKPFLLRPSAFPTVRCTRVKCLNALQKEEMNLKGLIAVRNHARPSYTRTNGKSDYWVIQRVIFSENLPRVSIRAYAPSDRLRKLLILSIFPIELPSSTIIHQPMCHDPYPFGSRTGVTMFASHVAKMA